MARAGVCSRRDAEAWIAEGRVSVNGAVLASPAFNVSEADDVRVDGKPLGKPERTRLFLFHKPRGLVTTARDPEGRATVFARLPPDLPRLVAIGRLDINTEGLLLLTNDGGPRAGARTARRPGGSAATGCARMAASTRRRSTGSATASPSTASNTAASRRSSTASRARTPGSRSGLREGKNREIKKILEHLGLAVNRLIRVSFGPFELGDLPEGEIMEVRTRVLRDQLGVKLAREAGADFDADLVVRDEPAPEPRPDERARGERGRRGSRPRSGEAWPAGARRGRGEQPVRTRCAGAPRAAEALYARAPAQACLGFAGRNRRRRLGRQRSAQAHRARRDAGPQGPQRRGRAHIPDRRGGAQARR